MPTDFTCGRKFWVTNSDGPLGDRTLPPPHHGAISLKIMARHKPLRETLEASNPS